MACYVIGDVQGCFDELMALMMLVGFSPHRDELWFVGDLVNRGPKSLEVLEWVMGLGEKAKVVLGNHDIHLLGIHAGLRQQRPGDTLDDILQSPKRQKLMDWLRHRPLIHVGSGDVLVHAGIWPQWTIADAQNLAGEVEAKLRADDYVATLARLYGGEPRSWREDMEGVDRWRIITNILTRMRYLTLTGEMDFAHHGPLAEAPDNLRPWFQEWDATKNPVGTVFCGHWSSLGLYQSPQVVMLDTGCVWGHTLTAMRLEDRKIFSVKALQAN